MGILFSSLWFSDVFPGVDSCRPDRLAGLTVLDRPNGSEPWLLEHDQPATALFASLSRHLTRHQSKNSIGCGQR